jgi:hypothetical protein
MTKKEKNQAWLVAVSCAFFFFGRRGRIIFVKKIKRFWNEITSLLMSLNCALLIEKLLKFTWELDTCWAMRENIVEICTERINCFSIWTCGFSSAWNLHES